MADAEVPQTPIKGVASYSKLLSVVHLSKYALYDTRVAVAEPVRPLEAQPTSI
ncbi:hypothetical protein DSM14862_02268 [Sulfitobacter indolifex]|nr:hypothetical protein DSM14862_02268 [Sulfitobacter indolifex]